MVGTTFKLLLSLSLPPPLSLSYFLLCLVNNEVQCVAKDTGQNCGVCNLCQQLWYLYHLTVSLQYLEVNHTNFGCRFILLINYCWQCPAQWCAKIKPLLRTSVRRTRRFLLTHIYAFKFVVLWQALLLSTGNTHNCIAAIPSLQFYSFFANLFIIYSMCLQYFHCKECEMCHAPISVLSYCCLVGLMETRQPISQRVKNSDQAP